MVPNHRPACNTILLWYLVNTQNMWGERYPLQRPIFKKDLKISWNNGGKLVHYTHIMWYVIYIYEFYYFCDNKIVNNNLIFRFWSPLVTILPILVKENGISNTQITTKLLNISIGQFGYGVYLTVDQKLKSKLVGFLPKNQHITWSSFFRN